MSCYQHLAAAATLREIIDHEMKLTSIKSGSHVMKRNEKNVFNKTRKFLIDFSIARAAVNERKK